MQYQEVAGGICAPKGFAAAGVHCGIRANHAEKYDLALIKADVRCAAAGVYTTNKVCGAPIKVDRAHLKDGYAQAIIVICCSCYLSHHCRFHMQQVQLPLLLPEELLLLF